MMMEGHDHSIFVDGCKSGDFESLKRVLLSLAPACAGYDKRKEGGDIYLCRALADWLAEWSDREVFVCDLHKPLAQSWHDNDYEYDKEKNGPRFTKLESGTLVRRALQQM